MQGETANQWIEGEGKYKGGRMRVGGGAGMGDGKGMGRGGRKGGGKTPMEAILNFPQLLN